MAVLDGDNLLFNATFSSERGHSAQLFVVLEQALAVAGCAQIAVGLGPGSYSGVRIAISAAIGLSLGSGARLAGLPSILALEVEDGRYCAIGDARRDAFYFAEIENGECVKAPRLCTRDELAERLEAAKCPVFASAQVAGFPQARLAFPSAERLARLAQAQRGIVMRDQLEPLYLRAPHITQPKPA